MTLVVEAVDLSQLPPALRRRIEAAREARRLKAEAEAREREEFLLARCASLRGAAVADLGPDLAPYAALSDDDLLPHVGGSEARVDVILPGLRLISVSYHCVAGSGWQRNMARNGPAWWVGGASAVYDDLDDALLAASEPDDGIPF